MTRIETKDEYGTRITFGRERAKPKPKRSTLFEVPRINNATSQANPQSSIGLGVHRSQVAEFNQMYEDAGIVGAGHTEDGTLMLESRQARNKVLELRGCRDNDACYGDYAGENG